MLTFNLKEEWFKKIRNKEKTHEYREVKSYWVKRIKKAFDFLNCDIEELRKAPKYPFNSISGDICFVCGYANKDDKEKRLKAKIKSISIINGKNTDLAIDKDVFDIEFELIKVGENELPKEDKEALAFNSWADNCCKYNGFYSCSHRNNSEKYCMSCYCPKIEEFYNSDFYKEIEEKK